ncbi:MAG TPA: substrate-binding domain-containing protein [Candidatus Hydrogenedentes bacterium]|nr:substrate-binding domain-containing protein [Candidatus Hydrogenedentota bacterium]HPG67131.1 substrate-binding domain-containing protein [Candidatus Hydrogenedentota bacterium]
MHSAWKVAVVVVAAALAGCSAPNTDTPAAGTPEKIVIGFLVKQPEELWFQNEWRFAQRCADQYAFDLRKIGVPDGEKALSAIDVLAASGAQGFVICTPDVRLGPAIMAKADSYNMKVFTVDDQFVGADGQFMDVPYMGLSAEAIGRNVGAALYEEFTRRAWPIEETAACAITFDELNTVKERTEGTTAALIEAGFPAERIYRGAEKTTDVPGAFDAANIVLTQHPEVKRWLVFSVNDEGVLGALRALEGRGYEADAIIGIGIGAGTGLTEFKKAKPTGYFATCMISPLRHGYETTEHLYKWIKDGVEPPRDVRTAGVLATRENYSQVLHDLGLEDVLAD